MTVREYAGRVANKINDTTVYTAEVKEVMKNNNVLMTGIIITGEKVMPLIYVDQFYNDNLTVDEAVREVIRLNLGQGKDIKEDLSGIGNIITDWNKTRHMVQPRLIGMNNDVSDLPHKVFQDLYIIYAVVISEVASVKVTNGILAAWGVTLDELDRVARENIQPVAVPMGEMLAELGLPLPAGEDMPTMLVITNENKMFGASSILSPEITDKFDQDMFIIPSSVHEMIAVPADDEMGLQLGQIIKEVNATTVAPEEVLGEAPYIFRVATGEIRKVGV